MRTVLEFWDLLKSVWEGEQKIGILFLGIFIGGGLICLYFKYIYKLKNRIHLLEKELEEEKDKNDIKSLREYVNTIIDFDGYTKVAHDRNKDKIHSLEDKLVKVTEENTKIKKNFENSEEDLRKCGDIYHSTGVRQGDMGKKEWNFDEEKE